MSSASTTTSASFTGQVLFCPTAEICQRHLVLVLPSVFPPLPLSLHSSLQINQPKASALPLAELDCKIIFKRVVQPHWVRSVYKKAHKNQVGQIYLLFLSWFLPFVLQSAKSLQGNKDSRILWVKDDFLLTTGFDMVRTSKVRHMTSLFLYPFPFSPNCTSLRPLIIVFSSGQHI